MDTQTLLELRTQCLPEEIRWKQRLRSVWKGNPGELDRLIDKLINDQINMDDWLKTNVNIMKNTIRSHITNSTIIGQIITYTSRIRSALKTEGVPGWAGYIKREIGSNNNLMNIELSFPESCQLEEALYYIFLFQVCLDSNTAPLFKYDFYFVPADL